ncbi:protein phosphatase 1 regulatory subunit 3C-B-like [Silurus meridionalis]|uniref:CBM21 domain-containing protein n=1 Tax=Silurus meridionalis TaxID=175797 RepID=A0A8T0B4B6_SILME|nr:protein phosphatase 1 regulatory subunit 3C-B-like [Silurus meridionalis]KAF7700805.1 hypothetical protein HF521_001970 [Silurus meridionalis]
MSAAKAMPVNLTMHMYLNHHPRVEQLLSTLKSHQALSKPSVYDSLRSRAARSPQIPPSPVSVLKCTSPCGTLKKKKRVVFADDKGLSLTAIRIFNTDPPASDVEEPVKEPPSVQSRKRLRLGFAQPSADLPSFHERMKKSLVCLESCSLMYGTLFGKVRVCNVNSEKAVNIRITYDSWRSHQDIPCTLIQQDTENSETELFFFNVPVSSSPSVQDRLEFCVTFRPGSSNMLLWDNNGGQNYQILVEDVNSEEASSSEKIPLTPQNFQSPKSLPTRNSPALYKSKSFSSFMYPMDMMKTLGRQENIIPKIY